MNSFKVTANFLQVLDNAINGNLEKVAEKKGIAVQELIMAFQESGKQKDVENNMMQFETIPICDRVAKISENKVDNEYQQEYLAYAS